MLPPSPELALLVQGALRPPAAWPARASRPRAVLGLDICLFRKERVDDRVTQVQRSRPPLALMGPGRKDVLVGVGHVGTSFVANAAEPVVVPAAAARVACLQC